MKHKTLGEALIIRLIRRAQPSARTSTKERIIAAHKVPSQARFYIAIAISILALLTSLNVLGLPWVEVGDERTRHHLLYLRDTGAINMPLSSWPVSWADISREMGQMHLDEMDQAQLWSYRYLRHELERAKKGIKTTKRFRVASSAKPFPSFSSDTREQTIASSETTFMNERIAVNIDAQVIDNPFDGDKYTLDGSFAAVTLGNWMLGIGNVERWWGPGWHSSLILSNNARPTLGMFAKRLESLGLDSPYFSIVGPWTIEFFANAIEEANASNNETKANFFGGRFAINPLQQLELGLNTTSIEIDDTFFGADPDSETKERMEFMGYDARFSANIKSTTLSLYGQIVEQNTELDLDPATLFGAELSFVFKSVHNRIMFEASNSEGVENSNTGLYDSAYDHSEYLSGYRKKGRNLAESAGANSVKRSIAGQHYFSNGHQLSWNYSNIQINDAGPSLNMYGSELVEQTMGELRYAFPFNEMTLIEVSAFQLSETMGLQESKNEKEINSGSSLTIRIRI